MIPKYQKIIYLLFKKIILMSKQIKTSSMQVSYRMILSSSNFTIVLLVVRVQ